MTQLRSVTCHMGSHSVTCYPTQVNIPRLNPSHAGRYSIYLPRRDGRLSCPSWLDSAAAGSRTSDLSITSPMLNRCTTKTGCTSRCRHSSTTCGVSSRRTQAARCCLACRRPTTRHCTSIARSWLYYRSCTASITPWCWVSTATTTFTGKTSISRRSIMNWLTFRIGEKRYFLCPCLNLRQSLPRVWMSRKLGAKRITLQRIKPRSARHDLINFAMTSTWCAINNTTFDFCLIHNIFWSYQNDTWILL